MPRRLRNRNLYIMLAADALLFAFSLCLSYLIRFEFSLADYYVSQLLQLLPVFIAVKAFTFKVFGLYRGMWRYTGFHDLWKLGQASALASLMLLAFTMYWVGFAGFSRSVFVIDLVLSIFMTSGLRLFIRKAYEQGLGGSGLSFFTRLQRQRSKTLLLGASQAGEQILREMFANPELGMYPIGFLDDDPSREGRALHGVPVLGRVDMLEQLLEEGAADKVVIALPEASGEMIRQIVDTCEGADVEFKILPGMGELLDGKVEIKDLREVNVVDLLGRKPVTLENERIAEYLRGKTVMVTGCGGSIGSELCRQIVAFEPGLLLLVDAGEYNLYSIEMELRHKYGLTNLKTMLVNLRDEPLVENVFAQYRPEAVFHAAAYKHVPLLERNPWEAVMNNILPSRTVMRMAAKYGTERFVLVSTDKAVRPTNVMGTSKRITELVLRTMVGKSNTKFMSVRFGNVIGSSGSVIPLFLDQIRRGGPVTVTHKDVTRYFMTIPEAAQLILQAGSMGEMGEIFLLKMGQPVKIADMARDLIRLSGKEPDKDIRIEFTGLREGEKLYEELITAGEDVVETTHDKIMLLQADGTWCGHGSQQAMTEWLEANIERLTKSAASFDACAIKQILSDVVPEYASQDAECILVAENGTDESPAA